MVTMAEIDEARGRANEALDDLQSLRGAGLLVRPRDLGSAREILIAEEGTAEHRLAAVRTEIEALLARWWAQGCREQCAVDEGCGSGGQRMDEEGCEVYCSCAAGDDLRRRDSERA